MFDVTQPSEHPVPIEDIESPQDSSFMENTDRTVAELKRTNFDGEMLPISNYLEMSPDEPGNRLFHDPGAQLTFVRIIRANEIQNEALSPQLDSLLAAVETRVRDASAGNMHELDPASQQIFRLVFDSVSEYYNVMQDASISRQDGVMDYVDRGTDLLGGAVSQLRENAASLSDTQRSVLMGGAFLGILYAYTSSGDTAKMIRKGINTLALTGLGIYAGNALTTVITGDSFLGNLDRLNQRSNEKLQPF
jgi:hypothetical protein